MFLKRTTIFQHYQTHHKNFRQESATGVNTTTNCLQKMFPAQNGV